jgi:hypothetical protein
VVLIAQASTVASGVLPGATLLVVLVIVGWGFGLAAAIACRCVDGVAVAQWRRVQYLGLALALTVGAIALGAYLLVLDKVGLV